MEGKRAFSWALARLQVSYLQAMGSLLSAKLRAFGVYIKLNALQLRAANAIKQHSGQVQAKHFLLIQLFVQSLAHS